MAGACSAFGILRAAAHSPSARPSSGWSVRQLERAITAAANRDAPSKADDHERSSVARSLTDCARRTIDVPVEVRARGEAFTIRIAAADLAIAESVLARLAVPQGPRS